MRTELLAGHRLKEGRLLLTLTVTLVEAVAVAVIVAEAEIVRVVLEVLLLLLEERVLERQVVAPVDEQLIFEVGGRVHVLAGLARASALSRSVCRVLFRWLASGVWRSG